MLQFAATTSEPWRNGGGRTRQLAASSTAAPFAWRLSVAELDTSGPFSTFPGVDRVLTLCGGPPIRLTVAGVEHEVLPYRPFGFPGDAVTSCEITTPTRDLNVMTRRDLFSAEVRVVQVGGAVAAGHADVTFAVPITGTATVVGARLELAELDALRLSPGSAVHLEGSGLLAVIRLTPRQPTTLR